MASLGDAVQSILTQGIDAVKSVKLARLQVNDPTYNAVGPYGQSVKVGQGTYYGQVLSSVPPVVWIGGAVLLIGTLILTTRR